MNNFFSQSFQSIKSVFQPITIEDHLENIDLNDFFTPDEVIEVEQIIANQPEALPIILRLTQAISNKDFVEYFSQISQLDQLRAEHLKL